MTDTLTPEQYQINQWIEKLDTLNVEYESRWGCGVLPQLVSSATAEKWLRHCQKIDDAITSNDLQLMVDLCEGAKRGLDALEQEAMRLGHKPHGAPVAWTVMMENGKELAICATRNDAAMCASNGAKERDMVVWTIQEVANLICNYYHDANKLGEPKPESVKAQTTEHDPFDFTKGDKINF